MKVASVALRPKIIIAMLAALAVGGLLWVKLIAFPFAAEATKADGKASAADTVSGDQYPHVDLSEKQAATLKIGPVGSRDFDVFKTAVGTIDFNENMLVQVFSQYPGKIIKASYNVGDDIKQGDILFTIDSPDLLQAESALLASAGVLELQKRTLGRLTNLLKAGGSAQKDVDQATSDQQTAEGNYKAARNAAHVFGKSDAEIDRILDERKVDSTLVVTSPISGRIISRNAAPGFLTQPGTAPAPYTVADVSTMWMIANVIEIDTPAYKINQAVDVRVPAYPDHVFKGHVTAVGATIDPNTHRQLVRSEIDDPEHLLRSGMFASFVIHVGEPLRSPAVRATGVVREGDGTMTVWVTNDRRRFTKRTVKVGIQQDGWDQILEGLRPDELVVVEGAVFLSNKLVTGFEG
jgi:cobalt-zinc-cadmium efflux system membrane fusion protein